MKKQHFETLAIQTERPPSGNREHSAPIFVNSGYRFHDSEHSRKLFADEVPDHVYSRYTNPSADEFSLKMAALEGFPYAFSTGTGMSAIHLGLISLLGAGDHVVAVRSLFGSSHQLFTKVLPRFQISYSYLDILSPETWEQQLTKQTKLLFFETPSNPGLDLVDLEWAVKFAKSHNLKVMVDNCFATPYLQRPGDFGVDVVAHSATKFIDGQGRTMGGSLLCHKADFDSINFNFRHTGPVISPFNAWVLSKSLETLAVRMEKHCSNALEVAKALEQRKDVKWVKYPGLASHPQHAIAKKQMRHGGGVVTFALEGGKERAIRFMDSLKMLRISANLGDTRTIATHPLLTTHSRLTPEDRLKVNITDDLVRVSIGLEHPDDILADIYQAIDRSK